MNSNQQRRLREIRDLLAGAPDRASEIGARYAKERGSIGAGDCVEIGALRGATNVAVIDLDDLLAELESASSEVRA